MSPAARPTGLSPRLVQVLAMFVDIAAAQAAALEAEAAPGVCWVRVVKPQAILRSVDARATHSAIAPIRSQEPAYVKRVADLARAQRAGLLVDCDGAHSAAVVTALGHSGALVAFVAGAQGVRELTLAQSAPGVTEWRRAA